MSASVLLQFHPLVQEWFVKRYAAPTDIQERAWPVIARGSHCLVVAPTGSGKTLTAFLAALNNLLANPTDRGAVRVLYVSPLKALNNDIERNLLEPLRELSSLFDERGTAVPSVRVAVRSGDTPESERRRMVSKPPEIFITTPESLNLILSSPRARAMLSGVRTVILDEIHALVGEKRGTHLITAVERLTLLAGEFQRVAISATVRPLEAVASFVGGLRPSSGLPHSGDDAPLVPRPVEVVRSQARKAYELRVESPPSVDGDEEEEGGRLEALARSFLGHVRGNRSTLLFVGTRTHAEKISSLMNRAAEGEIAYAHHGSLSREIRTLVEQRMKDGLLPAIVATNSLELGIDIGPLDEVLLVKTPVTVAGTLQRIGRAGHRVGETSRATFFPLAGRDFLDAAVMVEAVLEADIEPTTPLSGPLDVLAQIIVSMTTVEAWSPDLLYDFLRSTHPYQGLSRRAFDSVVEMLAGRYEDSRIRELKPRIRFDRLENSIEALPGAAAVLYSSGGTIPDRGYYTLRTAGDRLRVGELDEEFVWERRIGDVFAFGNRIWEIRSISDRDVEVVPTRRLPTASTFWRGEAPTRHFHFARRILRFLGRWGEATDSPEFGAYLREGLGMDDEAATSLRHILAEQRSRTGLPTLRRVVLEVFSEPADPNTGPQILIHTLWGGRINEPLGLMLSAAFEERYGIRLDVFSDNDTILVMLPDGDAAAGEIVAGEVASLLAGLGRDDILPLLRRRLESSGYFGGRFRENAGRALLLPKKGFGSRTPLWLNRVRAKRLLERVSKYDDFPILTETWRQCLQDEFDLENLGGLLDELRTRAIELTIVETSVPSPFAANVVWRRTNFYMYESDLPNPTGTSALSDSAIAELIDGGSLRPQIPARLVAALDRRLRRTEDGYGPAGARDLVDWLTERLLMPPDEFLHHLLALGAGEGESLDGRILVLASEGGPAAVTSLEGASRCLAAGLPLTVARKVDVPRCVGSRGAAEDPWSAVATLSLDEGEIGRIETLSRRVETDTEEVVRTILAFRATVGYGEVTGLTGLDRAAVDAALQTAFADRQVLRERVADTDSEAVLVDRENLERLLRMLRRSRREDADLQPRSPEEFPAFVARLHGICATDSDSEEQRLATALSELALYPAPAAIWEADLLAPRTLHDPSQPQRLGPLLDSHLASSHTVWLGCGKEKLTFADESEASLLGAGFGRDESSLLPAPVGSFSFAEIVEYARKRQDGRLDPAELERELWNEVWKGRLTGDGYAALRRYLAGAGGPTGAGAARSAPTRRSDRAWRGALRSALSGRTSAGPPGRWRVPPLGEGAGDPVGALEEAKDKARILLDRYGVVARSLCAREHPSLRWSEVFPALRILELAGEVVGGVFFSGLSAPQFASANALSRLAERGFCRSFFRIHSMDPASLCGTGIEGLELPPRNLATHLLYAAGRLFAVSRRNGAALDIRTGPQDPMLGDAEVRAGVSDFFRFLFARTGGRLVVVREVNGTPTRKSPYEGFLRTCGFRPDYKGYVFETR